MKYHYAIVLELLSGEIQFAEYPFDENSESAAADQMKRLVEIGKKSTCEVKEARLIRFEILQTEILKEVSYGD